MLDRFLNRAVEKKRLGLFVFCAISLAYLGGAGFGFAAHAIGVATYAASLMLIAATAIGIFWLLLKWVIVLLSIGAAAAIVSATGSEESTKKLGEKSLSMVGAYPIVFLSIAATLGSLFTSVWGIGVSGWWLLLPFAVTAGSAAGVGWWTYDAYRNT